MIQRISPLTAIALIAVVTALSNTITANAQSQEQLCACSPRSYSFQLLLDNDCSSSTLTADADNGISNVNCQIATVGLKKKRRLRRQLSREGEQEGGERVSSSNNNEDVTINNYYPVWKKGGYCDDDPSRRPSSYIEMPLYETAEECCEASFSWIREQDNTCLLNSASSTAALKYGSAIQQNDNENDVIIATSNSKDGDIDETQQNSDVIATSNSKDGDTDDPYYQRLQSQLHSSLPTVIRQAASSTPFYISSVYFFEYDTSGTLALINEDDSYLSTNLTNGTVISYDSISQQLNATMELEEQLQYVPGGAGLFLFASNEKGEVVMRGQLVWEFNTGDCDVAPQLSGKSLGWIGFDEITPAANEFCPAFTKSLGRSSKSSKTSKSAKDQALFPKSVKGAKQAGVQLDSKAKSDKNHQRPGSKSAKAFDAKAGSSKSGGSKSGSFSSNAVTSSSKTGTSSSKAGTSKATKTSKTTSQKKDGDNFRIFHSRVHSN